MIITKGRTDLTDFWRLSGIYDNKLSHHPILTFHQTVNGDIDVEIWDKAEDVIISDLTDDVKCMAQWGGQWRSDFFQFTVGELRKHAK